MNLVYKDTIKLLKKMTDEQLIELFNDIDDLSVVDRIAFCASTYLNAVEILSSSKDDNKQQDDAQRYLDIQSENRRPY